MGILEDFQSVIYKPFITTAWPFLGIEPSGTAGVHKRTTDLNMVPTASVNVYLMKVIEETAVLLQQKYTEI